MRIYRTCSNCGANLDPGEICDCPDILSDLAIYKDGKQLWEIDKRNMKCVVDGVDYMEPVRKAIGK